MTVSKAQIAMVRWVGWSTTSIYIHIHTHIYILYYIYIMYYVYIYIIYIYIMYIYILITYIICLFKMIMFNSYVSLLETNAESWVWPVILTHVMISKIYGQTRSTLDRRPWHEMGFSEKNSMFFDVPHFCLVPNYCEAALHSLFFLIVSKVVSALLRRQWGW